MLFGVGVSCRICILLLVIYMQAVADELPRFGKEMANSSAIVYL